MHGRMAHGRRRMPACVSLYRREAPRPLVHVQHGDVAEDALVVTAPKDPDLAANWDRGVPRPGGEALGALEPLQGFTRARPYVDHQDVAVEGAAFPAADEVYALVEDYRRVSRARRGDVQAGPAPY